MTILLYRKLIIAVVCKCNNGPTVYVYIRHSTRTDFYNTKQLICDKYEAVNIHSLFFRSHATSRAVLGTSGCTVLG